MRGPLLVFALLMVLVAGATGTTAAANTTTTTAGNASTPMPIATNTTSTATTTPTTTTRTTAGSAASTMTGDGSTLKNDANITMTDSARITGWEFSNNRVRVAIEADSLTTVTITDGAAGLEDAGASRIPQTTQRVWGGETTIVTMPVATAFDGHVVGVGIGDTGVRLSTDMQQGEDPLQYFGGTSGLFSGIGIALLTSLLGAWYVLRKEETGVRKA